MMAIDPEFRPLMQEVINVYSSASVNKYGKRIHASGPSGSFNARLVYDTVQSFDNEGREVVQTGRAILFGPAASVTVDFEVELPDGSKPRIISVDTITDETGADHHSVIRFGR
jgi:hypothetical protein